MPSWFEVGNIWRTLSEVDLRPIRAQAERTTLIAIASDDSSAKSSLISALCQRPSRSSPSNDPGWSAPAPDNFTLAVAPKGINNDLIVLILNGNQDDRVRERQLFEGWRAADKRIVIIYNRSTPPNGLEAFVWQGDRLIGGLTSDSGFVEHEFVGAVLSLLPDRHLSLARHYPLFRVQAAQQLIADTSLANATYSLSTGLAEIVPILDVPFNVADMIILTKAQAIMCYKLGLALGLPGNWQDHLAAFGSTIGSGFLWRQIARQLVGLIPVWGIVPKVAVAYAGTYVLGQAILQWYLTGRQVTPAMMGKMYRDALDQGRATARTLIHRTRGSRKRRQLPARSSKVCGICRSANPEESNYCGMCGSPLVAPG